MKSLQELYNEVLENDELKKAYLEAVKTMKIEDFLKSHDCEATVDQFKAFMAKKESADVELSVDELENVAGGGCGKSKKKKEEPAPDPEPVQPTPAPECSCSPDGMHEWRNCGDYGLPGMIPFKKCVWCGDEVDL